MELIDQLKEIDLAFALLDSADKSDMYEVRIETSNGKLIQASFGGKRVWKTRGSAKTAITKAMQNIFWNTSSRIPKHRNSRFEFDYQLIQNITDQHDYRPTYQVTGMVKTLVKHLMDSGKIQILQCR